MYICDGLQIAIGKELLEILTYQQTSLYLYYISTFKSS